MKDIFIILCVLILLSCSNNQKKKRSGVRLPPEEIKVVKEKLDSSLVKGVLKLIRSNKHLKYPEIPLSESFIIIGFLLGSETRIESDSIVNISYYVNYFDPYNKENNFKGIMNIYGYNIAIFDRRNFGDKFYNADSLKQIPLNSFKCYPMKDILIEQFYVHNGKLNYHGLGIIPSPNGSH